MYFPPLEMFFSSYPINVNKETYLGLQSRWRSRLNQQLAPKTAGGFVCCFIFPELNTFVFSFTTASRHPNRSPRFKFTTQHVSPFCVFSFDCTQGLLHLCMSTRGQVWKARLCKGRSPTQVLWLVGDLRRGNESSYVSCCQAVCSEGDLNSSRSERSNVEPCSVSNISSHTLMIAKFFCI